MKKPEWVIKATRSPTHKAYIRQYIMIEGPKSMCGGRRNVIRAEKNRHAPHNSLQYYKVHKRAGTMSYKNDLLKENQCTFLLTFVQPGLEIPILVIPPFHMKIMKNHRKYPFLTTLYS